MSELHEMNEHLQSIDKRLDRHIGVVEVILENQQRYMESIESRQKEQNIKFVDAITSITTTFDKKLDVYREAVADNISKHYYDRSDIDNLHHRTVTDVSMARRREITEAVERVERDMVERVDASEGKAKLIAWVAASVMGVFTTIAGLALTAIEVLGGVS